MFYHGTTLENARHLLSGGEKTDPVWNCSYDDYLYVWSKEAIEESEGLEPEEVEDYCLRVAFESASITAAASATPQNELIVLVFDFPEADVYDDLSCENMSYARRVNSDLDATDLENSLIKLYSAKHNPRLDPFVLSGLYDNDYFNFNSLDSDLKEAVKVVVDNKVYLDSIFEYDWKEISKERVTA